jgi:hypothetical protein
MNNFDFENIENSTYILITSQMYFFLLPLFINICRKFKVLNQSMLILNSTWLPAMYCTINYHLLRVSSIIMILKTSKIPDTLWWLVKCIFFFCYYLQTSVEILKFNTNQWRFWSQWDCLPCIALSFVKSIINNHDFEASKTPDTPWWLIKCIFFFYCYV